MTSLKILKDSMAVRTCKREYALDLGSKESVMILVLPFTTGVEPLEGHFVSCRVNTILYNYN